MRRTTLTAAFATLLCLLGAGGASADPFDDFRNQGSVDPCQYSDGELQRSLDSLPPDVRQYSPGLADQLAAGREGCGGGAPGSGADTRQFEAVPGLPTVGGDDGGAGGVAAGGRPRIPDPPAPDPRARERLAEVATPPVSATTRAEVPTWVIILAAAVGLGGLLAALARSGRLGGGRFGPPLRASFAEAGGRGADAAAELWDSLRLGR